MQREHADYAKEQGEGIAGEVDHIDQRTRQMDQRLVRIETMISELHNRKREGEADNSTSRPS